MLATQQTMTWLGHCPTLVVGKFASEKHMVWSNEGKLSGANVNHSQI